LIGSTEEEEDYLVLKKGVQKSSFCDLSVHERTLSIEYHHRFCQQVEAGCKMFGDLSAIAREKDLPQFMGMLENFMKQRR
jgi:hypothetical protein